MLHPYLSGTRWPRVLAHRGLVDSDMAAAGVMANSRVAIQAAVDAGCDFVETDCMLTRDGRVVLLHDDEDMLLLTGAPGKVSDVRLAELTALMAGRGGVMTLEEALTAHPQTRFNLDVKVAAAAEPVGQIIAPHAHRVLLTSFSDRHRKRALAAAGGARPAASPGQWGMIRILAALMTGIGVGRVLRGVDALQIPERQGPVRVLSPRLLRAAHRHGVEVHVWTVNDERRMHELVALGVDGIVTDRADIALASLRSG